MNKGGSPLWAEEASCQPAEVEPSAYPTGVPSESLGYEFDDLQAAYAAGFDTGLIHRGDLQARIEERAYELLHARSLEMLGMAQSAAQQKGPAWAAMMQAAADVPWGECP